MAAVQEPETDSIHRAIDAAITVLTNARDRLPESHRHRNTLNVLAHLLDAEASKL